MGPQIIVSAHAPVEITKSQKLGLQYAVLETAVFFTSLEWNERSSNSTKNSNRGIEVSLNYYFYYYYHYCYYYNIFIYSRIIKIKIKIFNFAV